MSRIVVVLAILAVFSAVLIHQLHQRIYGLPIPEDFNPNATFTLRLCGFAFNITRDWCAFGSRWGFIDDRFVCVRTAFKRFAQLALEYRFADVLEVNDTDIFGTKVRIYRPLNTTKGQDGLLPAVIYYHGGGWTIGCLEAYDAYCRRLAASAQVVVVSADYRQAPEYLYPTAFHDCYNVAVGLLNNGSMYGVDIKRIMLAGDSAGGNLAAAVSHYLAYVGEKHCKKQYLSGQVLIYPALQLLNLSLPSHKENEKAAILSTRNVAEFISEFLVGNTSLVEAILAGNHSKHLENTTYMSYLKIPNDDTTNTDEKTEEQELPVVDKKPLIPMSDLAAEALYHFKASPLMASSFRGIPPTFILSAEHDPLRDENFLYAKRLKDAGIDVEHKHYNSFHGFATVTSEPDILGTEEGWKARDDVIEYVKRIMNSLKTEQEEEDEGEEDHSVDES